MERKIERRVGSFVNDPNREQGGIVTGVEIPLVRDRVTTERAKEVLGKDFLGVEAVRGMEANLNAVGQNVEFVIPQVPPIPYSDTDLQIAKEVGEMLVLRVGEMKRKKEGVSEVIPISLINFRKLFRQDPVGDIQTLFWSFSGHPMALDWYKDQPFATRGGEISLGWALVAKKPYTYTVCQSWDRQTEMLNYLSQALANKGASSTNLRRRTATEATWDTLLYYMANREQILRDSFDQTQTQESGGDFVVMGGFNYFGLQLDHWVRKNPGDGNTGVVYFR